MICTVCCGTEREQSVNCPLRCEYLQQAHQFETHAEPENVPNLDIDITESFIEEHEFLIVLLSAPIAKLVEQEPAITDHDMREALAALVNSARSLQSGIVYDQVPTNPYAAMVCDAMRSELESLRRRAAEADEEATITDKQVLGVYAFLQRLEYSWNNGRRKSKAFLDLVTAPFRGAAADPQIALEPEEPRIIL